MIRVTGWPRARPPASSGGSTRHRSRSQRCWLHTCRGLSSWGTGIPKGHPGPQVWAPVLGGARRAGKTSVSLTDTPRRAASCVLPGRGVSEWGRARAMGGLVHCPLSGSWRGLARPGRFKGWCGDAQAVTGPCGALKAAPGNQGWPRQPWKSPRAVPGPLVPAGPGVLGQRLTGRRQ